MLAALIQGSDEQSDLEEHYQCQGNIGTRVGVHDVWRRIE